MASAKSILDAIGYVKNDGQSKSSKAANIFYQAYNDIPKTGKAITLDYFHNTEKAPTIPGDEFAQSNKKHGL